jgi:glycosyltransferase involved in cell wall biosynthesis
MKKNVALISPDQNSYSETFIQAHKNYLDANVFYYYGEYLPFYLENKGALLTNWNRFSGLIKRILKLTKFNFLEQSVLKSFKNNRIEIVYAEYGQTGVAVLNICKKLNLPLIVNFHGYDASGKSVLEDYKKSYAELFDYARDIVVVSKVMRKNLILLGANSEKITYTPCAPNDSFFELNPAFSENAFIAVGRFVDKKAPYYTILAFQKVLNKYSDAKLYFCGNGLLYNTCVNLVIYFGISKNVIFLGSVSAQEQKQLYERVIGFVQHSITALNGDMEGTPVSVLEASAAGLPIISTKHAGISDVVQHEKTGLLVDEHDVEQMAKYMIYLLENRDYAKSLGAAGRNLMKSNFSMEHHIGILNKLLY